MGISTIFVNIFASWFLLYVADEVKIDSVSACSAMNLRSNVLGDRLSPTDGYKVSSNKLSFVRTTTSMALLNTRGGADNSDYEEDSSEEEDEYDVEEEESEDDEDIFGDFDFDENSVDDFKEENIVDRLIEEYHRTPPITKAYLTASVAVTAFGYFMANNQFPPVLTLEWNKVFKGAQIWRPFTAFLNLGSFGLIGYPMTINFVHQYMSLLERIAHDKPYDFWVMLLFGMTSMLVGYPVMKLSPRFLGHNFSTFLVYIWSRMFEGLEISVFEFITIKSELLPWFMIAQTALLEGEPPVLDLLGIAFGHVYYHCYNVGMLRAPDWLKTWYDESPAAQTLRKKYKTISSDFVV